MPHETKTKPLIRNDVGSERWRVFRLPSSGKFFAAAPRSLYNSWSLSDVFFTEPSPDQSFKTIQEATAYADRRARDARS